MAFSDRETGNRELEQNFLSRNWPGYSSRLRRDHTALRLYGEECTGGKMPGV
jgi:hypothetical protein